MVKPEMLNQAGVPEMAVTCTQLRKAYGPVVAVADLTLEVRRGECFGLLGPNGAGKTTTIEILEGLLTPDAGDVEVLGLRWAHHGVDLRQRLGIQLQETQLADKLTVEETLRLFRSFYRRGRTRGAADRRAQTANGPAASASCLADRDNGSRSRALAGDPGSVFLGNRRRASTRRRRQLWALLDQFRARGGTIL